MRIYLVSVLPEIFGSFLDAGLLGKARKTGLLETEVITPREFASDKHRTVDDAPFGGGSGMVMMAGPLVASLEKAERLELERGGARPLRILLTPQGERFTQARARALSTEPALTLVSGRYEGVDERARRRVDLELSLGDFVMMGGEVAAMAVMEAVVRLIPGVLGNADSITEESHSAGLLEYPQYTRPAEIFGEKVPDALMSGHHANVAAWRRRQAIERTLARRPDLLEGRALSPEEAAIVAELRRASRGE
jgi:tRNA (guanine37-N1)-methyltransferase